MPLKMVANEIYNIFFAMAKIHNNERLQNKHAKGFFVVKLSYISNDVDTMNYCQIMAEKLMNYCQIMAENLIAC